jgi:hypothetical protein
MSDLSDSRPDRTLEQLDLALRELPREHGQVLNLDAFRRHLEHTSARHTAPQSRDGADTETAGAEAQLKHALSLAFADLGGAAFALAHHGALNDKRLAAHVQRIHELYTQLDALAHTTSVDQPDHSTPAAHAATA